MKNPVLVFAGLAVTGALVLTGCSTEPEDTTAGGAITSTSVQDVADTSTNSGDTTSTNGEVQYDDLDIKEMDTAVDGAAAVNVTLADGASSSDSGVSVDGDTVTITSGGTYNLSGSLTAGSIVVDAPDEDVTVILDGVDVTAAGVGAFNVVDAKNVVVYLADGSENSLSDADGAAVDESDDDAPNAAVYSTADLWFAGTGSLSVSGVNDGITSKDSLVITAGTISVTAGDDGVRGKDHLVIRDGSLTVDAGGDALKSDNEGKSDDPAAVVGVIWIEGGTIDLKAGSDAADAARQVTINGGDLNIAAGDDGLHSDGVLRIDGGSVNISESYEGVEGAYMYLSGGDVVVVATDDGINVAGGTDSTADVTTNTTPDTPADAASAGLAPAGDMPGGGDMPVNGMRPEGMPERGAMPGDGTRSERPGGDSELPGEAGPAMSGSNSGDPHAAVTVATDLSAVTVTALEDGGFGGPAEGDNGDRFLEISGGTYVIDTQSDGIDVNGSMTMTGGTVVVTSTSDNSQGALDVDDTFTITGGALAANGAAGMAVGPEAGAQGSLGIIFSSALPAETVITITDSSGADVGSFTTTEVSQSLVFSSDQIIAGTDYSVTVGGSVTGDSIGGLTVDGSVSGGDAVGTITAE
ncbi:carbohydrate-binding domain-containing protein [Demequina oxidasica]|uniref:carbohydrate-binding domain-containing protein n=1 Tax=Demequina oxidasica TaxID=676199 RepID=UPI0007856EC1|nr:carbohydrate-binding domain-containing protein [Demequina oxidasica]